MENLIEMDFDTRRVRETSSLIIIVEIEHYLENCFIDRSLLW